MKKDEEIYLRRLDENDERIHRDFVAEFIQANEDFIPINAFNVDMNYSGWLKKTRDISLGKNLPNGWVPSTVYFLFRKGEGKIIGAIDIRHELNDYLLQFGGHIGYGVVPSERKKGYAKRMLAMGLEICKEMGINKVMITCNKENVGSAKTILGNGGIFENEVLDNKGRTRKRHWISL
jgi:predicted acetyltransferase